MHGLRSASVRKASGPKYHPLRGPTSNLLGTGDIFELNVLGFIVAVIAAVALVGVTEGLAGRRNSSRWPADGQGSRAAPVQVTPGKGPTRT